MIPRTVPIVCAKAPRHIVYVPAIRDLVPIVNAFNERPPSSEILWRCSFCGQRVKVTW